MVGSLSRPKRLHVWTAGGRPRGPLPEEGVRTGRVAVSGAGAMYTAHPTPPRTAHNLPLHFTGEKGEAQSSEWLAQDLPVVCGKWRFRAMAAVVNLTSFLCC